MSEELLPCPFCGVENTDVGFVAHTAECYLMRKYMGGKKRELIISWNTRHYPPEVTAVLEAAKEYRHAQFLDKNSLLKLLKAVNDLEESEKRE